MLKADENMFGLRGYDPDNDLLTFGIRQIEARQTFEVKSVGDYEADVILISNLKKGASYDMTVYVTDGQSTTDVQSTVKVTDSNSKQQVFQSQTHFISVPEDAVVGRQISEIFATIDKKWMNVPTFELRGSKKFDIIPDFTADPDSSTVKAEIRVNELLDYEDKNFYRLTVLALNGYREYDVDTRNVASLDVAVVVEDIQDTAPQWKSAPPVSRILDNINVGDKVLTLVAEDGDRGDPRTLEYSFDPPSSPWIPYFNLAAKTGEITLKRPIDDLRKNLFQQGPMILPVTVRETLSRFSKYLAKSNSIEIGLILVDGENNPPKFASDRYVGYISENSPSFTPVEFKDSNYVPRVTDNDQGSNGTFQLFLDGVDAFEVSPNIGSHDLVFTLRVKNTAKIDYEKVKKFSFKLIAKELKSKNPLKTYVDVVVFVNDENDHKPEFAKSRYEERVNENADAGERVTQIQAADKDSGSFGVVKYTKITGQISDMFILNRDTGVITVRTSIGLDREAKVKHELMVEARDDDGNGQSSYVELTILLDDANDNKPIFPAPKFYIAKLIKYDVNAKV
ncbi:Cadherin-86C [Nymphon striatum]|nr:Cadherin-86C [Nymphon striatum]